MNEPIDPAGLLGRANEIVSTGLPRTMFIAVCHLLKVDYRPMPAYILMMGAAAALGFAKLLILAYILPAPQFGSYAAAAGASTLVSAVLSLGLIEGTIKSFPRDWSDGHHERIVGRSKGIARAVALATVPIGILGLAGATLVERDGGGLFVGFVAVLALAMIWGRVVSAMNVSIGDTAIIQHFSLFRSSSAILAVCAGGYFFGWYGAILGEILAVLASDVQGIWAVRKILPLGAPRMRSSPDYRLYISAMLTNATTSGDRPLVGALAGPGVAGAYAFALLIAQVGQVLVNIISQKAGPDIVRLQRPGASMRPTFQLFALPFAATVFLAFSMFSVAVLAAGMPFGEAILAKYGVGLTAIGISCFIAITYLYVILEYAVVAIDQERWVTAASAVSAGAFVCGAIVAWQMHAGVDGYLAALALARMLQMAILGFTITPRGPPSPALTE